MGVFVGTDFILDVVGILALFYILKSIMPIDFTALVLILFPLSLRGLKSYSLCLIVVAAFVRYTKYFNIPSMVLFWIISLFCAFYIYDEGIILGISCIVTSLFVLLVNKDRKQTIKFSWGYCFIGIICIFSSK